MNTDEELQYGNGHPARGLRGIEYTTIELESVTSVWSQAL